MQEKVNEEVAPDLDINIPTRYFQSFMQSATLQPRFIVRQLKPILP